MSICKSAVIVLAFACFLMMSNPTESTRPIFPNPCFSNNITGKVNECVLSLGGNLSDPKAINITKAACCKVWTEATNDKCVDIILKNYIPAIIYELITKDCAKAAKSLSPTPENAPATEPPTQAPPAAPETGPATKAPPATPATGPPAQEPPATPAPN